MEEEEVDNAAGTVYPYYDPDNNIIFTAGKGDSNIKYYEVNDEEPYVHFLSAFSSGVSQRGLGWMPKRGCDVTNNEIARFYKLHDDKCEPITMTVPRKSDLFQDDIFPDFTNDTPALTAEEWIEGKNALPKKSSWRGVFDAKKGGKANGQTTTTKVAKVAKVIKKSAPSAGSNGPSGDSLPEGFGLEDLKAMQDAIAKLNKTVRRQNKRIKKIEQVIGEVVAEDGDSGEGEE
jgi:coronin-1B/1C/6